MRLARPPLAIACLDEVGDWLEIPPSERNAFDTVIVLTPEVLDIEASVRDSAPRLQR